MYIALVAVGDAKAQRDQTERSNSHLYTAISPKGLFDLPLSYSLPYARLQKYDQLT